MEEGGPGQLEICRASNLSTTDRESGKYGTIASCLIDSWLLEGLCNGQRVMLRDCA